MTGLLAKEIFFSLMCVLTRRAVACVGQPSETGLHCSETEMNVFHFGSKIDQIWTKLDPVMAENSCQQVANSGFLAGLQLIYLREVSEGFNSEPVGLSCTPHGW